MNDEYAFRVKDNGETYRGLYTRRYHIMRDEWTKQEKDYAETESKDDAMRIALAMNAAHGIHQNTPGNQAQAGGRITVVPDTRPWWRNWW